MSQPPVVGMIHPLILKDGELFFVCDHEGRVDSAPALGLGLFHRDCRFLRRYELRLGSVFPSVLMQSATEGFTARFDLTNPPLALAGQTIPEHALSIARQLTVHADWSLLYDGIALRNCTLDPLRLELIITIEAEFEDVFSLRGTPPKKRGDLLPACYEGGSLLFRYRGADGIIRDLTIACSPAPAHESVIGSRAELAFALSLEPQHTAEINLALKIAETAEKKAAPPAVVDLPAPRRSAEGESEIARRWLAGFARIESDNPRFDAALRRSLHDIRLLTTERERGRFIAAGVPWYVALFGRDSLMPALQCLAFRPELAAHTLRLLAQRQGRRNAPEQKEEPGKILHELRVGEMANLGEVPQRPGFGSVDATLIFLILLARHAKWVGSTALFDELRGAVERALDWVDRAGDGNGDGYIDYDNGLDGSPANQSWKDSADAITNPDGSLVRGRIATVELQAYAYLAWSSIAELYATCRETAAADRLAAKAEQMRHRFNRDFWMETQGCYCLALDRHGRQVGVISSNPGHALWSGIVEPKQATRCADRLMAPDMFSGWGVRTLSERERRFNPIGYHTGSVWPFDNSLILAGFCRYGRDDLAKRLFSAQLAAAFHFDNIRLPEFFAGVVRRGEAGPARCPRADPLQAWSAGALPFMVTSLLNLEPDGFARRLRVRPILPDGVDRIDLSALRIGSATVNLRIERAGGQTRVRVRSHEGAVEIEA